MHTTKQQPKSKTSRNTKNTKTAKKRLSVVSNKSESALKTEEVSSRIAIAAYFKAQARGFAPGHELDDWLAAEAEVKQ